MNSLSSERVTVVDQVAALRTVISGISVIGALLSIRTLPLALPDYTCPSGL